MPPEAELLEGLRHIIPAQRPTGPVGDSATDKIVDHFYNLVDRTGCDRDSLLEILRCNGQVTDESKARSLAFLATADQVSATATPGQALDQVEFLLAVWFVVERDAQRFDEVLGSGQPSLVELTVSGSLGQAMRALQLTPDYAARKLMAGTES